MNGWRRRNLILVIVAGVGAGLVILWLWGNRTRVEVLSIDRWEPEVLSVMVDSCNGAPEADVVELGDGRYEVEARTTQAYDAGHDCGDVVEIPVDPNLDSLEVVDRVSGDTFLWPEDSVAVVDIDGTWRMVEVNGDQVEVDVNTAEIPEITIDAGFLAGILGCNNGGGELLQDGSTLEAAFIESTQELCTVADGGDAMVPTERTLVQLLGEGVTVERSDDRMTWRGEAGTVTFDRIEG
jgi:heat shock protein HslJ